MNRLIFAFKECAHQAGEICRVSNGQLVRRFGLSDFLENKLVEADTAPDIAIKALEYFCDEKNPHDNKFRLGVLAVGIFLDENHASAPRENLQQPLKDLVAILVHSPSEEQLRAWIRSHFE